MASHLMDGSCDGYRRHSPYVSNDQLHSDDVRTRIAYMSRRKQLRPLKRSLFDCQQQLEEDASKGKEKKRSQHEDDVVPSTSSQPVFRYDNPLKALEKSLLKIQRTSSNNNNNNNNNKSKTGDNKLADVPTIYERSSCESRSKQVSSILKCLQCGREEATMELLVKHMQNTQHFHNLPRTYSSMLQVDRQKVLNIKLQAKAEKSQLECKLCSQVPVNIDRHLREIHSIHTHNDWLKSVRLIQRSGTKEGYFNNILSLACNTVNHSSSNTSNQ